jgi:hypothetical protein
LLSPDMAEAIRVSSCDAIAAMRMRELKAKQLIRWLIVLMDPAYFVVRRENDQDVKQEEISARSAKWNECGDKILASRARTCSAAAKNCGSLLEYYKVTIENRIYLF